MKAITLLKNWFPSKVHASPHLLLAAYISKPSNAKMQAKIEIYFKQFPQHSVGNKSRWMADLLLKFCIPIKKTSGKENERLWFFLYSSISP